MPINEIKPFATGVGANIVAPSTYVNEPYLQQGFGNGILEAYDLNTVLRQTTFVSAMLAQFTAENSGIDVMDDGDVEGLLTIYEAALKGALLTDLLRYAPDTSSTPNTLQLSPTPAVATLAAGQSFLVRPANANTGPVQAGVNAIAPVPVLSSGGAQLGAGDMAKGGLYVISFDGTQFRVIGSTNQNALWHYGDDTGTANTLAVATSPPVAAYGAGLVVAVRVANANTGPTTVNANGLGPVTVTRSGGGPLQASDLAPGMVIVLLHDGTKFQIINALGAASESSLLHHGDDTGTANAVVSTVVPPISAYGKGVAALISIANSNTGPTTINLNGLGTRALVRSNGTPTQAGDVAGGTLALVAYDGVNFVLLGTQTSTGGGGGAGAGTVNYAALLSPYFLTVLSATTTTPPSSPASGDAYVVPANATGPWASVTNQIAQWDPANGWIYRTVPRGFIVTVVPTTGVLSDVLERTATGWRSKFATSAEITAGTSTTAIVSPAGLAQALAGLAVGGGQTIYVNSNITLGAGRYLVDSRGGPLTLTLPASPAPGLAITLLDFSNTWATNTVTLARNGLPIQGVNEDLILDVPDLEFNIAADGVANTWKVF